MLDVTKLSKEERRFVTGIINRLDSGMPRALAQNCSEISCKR
jgi:hypothetical protein